jgi:hypothetical protein
VLLHLVPDYGVGVLVVAGGRARGGGAGDVLDVATAGKGGGAP